MSSPIKFQFYDSTIKSFFFFCKIDCNRNFNSTIVRLKEINLINLIMPERDFNSTIVRLKDKFDKFDNARTGFQFYDSTIKSVPKRRDLFRCHRHFNSTIVRLKVVQLSKIHDRSYTFQFTKFKIEVQKI